MYERDVSREVRKSRGAGAEQRTITAAGILFHGPCTPSSTIRIFLNGYIVGCMEIWHMHDGDCYPVSIFYGCADRRHKRAL